MSNTIKSVILSCTGLVLAAVVYAHMTHLHAAGVKFCSTPFGDVSTSSTWAQVISAIVAFLLPQLVQAVGGTSAIQSLIQAVVNFFTNGVLVTALTKTQTDIADIKSEVHTVHADLDTVKTAMKIQP